MATYAPSQDSSADFTQLGIVSSDSHMLEVLGMARKVAVTDANLLIRGESGTGKDLLASAIHFLSKRRSGPLVKIDCAGLPVALIESELFGYEKGAFTDAHERKPGRLESAHRGTLVLDGIEQLQLSAQSKILRVIEEKQFQRLGGMDSLAIDTRIIALTNVDLEGAIHAGQFRQDLYYRLNILTLHLPPLRERRDDIPQLYRYFLKQFDAKYGKKCQLSADSEEMLNGYDWPGNVRELKNLIERAVVVAEKTEIQRGDFPAHLWNIRYMATCEKLTLQELEKRYILEILRHTKGNKSQAAKILGIHRKTLLEKTKLYGL
ncbi:MAG: sigma-54-dependent Fis family transcriptional regulator [Acidobacteria bacterium]|nr:sigma-54-dependent Fis family transcriptional regulator [Acidobacteriota bacterium]